MEDLQKNKKFFLESILIFSGVLLWLITGIILSNRPAGNPPVPFRNSKDLMLQFGLGLTAIGTGFSIYFLKRIRTEDKYFTVLVKLPALFSVLYLLGTIIRKAILDATGWEPLMPSGFLLFIICWLLIGIQCLKKRYLSSLISWTIIITSLCLLSFNDQYNPYAAPVFALLIAATFILINRSHDKIITN